MHRAIVHLPQPHFHQSVATLISMVIAVALIHDMTLKLFLTPQPQITITMFHHNAHPCTIHREVSAHRLVRRHLEGLISAVVKLLRGLMDEHHLVVQRLMTMSLNLVILSSKHVTITKLGLGRRTRGLTRKNRLRGRVTLGELLVRKQKRITSCRIGCSVL